MADYYPLISRAVRRLDANNAEARRHLYDHARTALLKQLEASEPPLTASQKINERLSLEQAIRKVEVESARSGL